MSGSEDKSSTESNVARSNRALDESISMLSSYFDLEEKDSARLSPDDDEPLPSMFSRSAEANTYGPSRGKSPTLILIGSSLILATCGILFSLFTFSSDKEAAVSAASPEYPQTVETDTSLPLAAPDPVEVPHAGPASPHPAMAGDEPWSDTIEAYKKLLAQRDASNASAVRQKANDRGLGQFEAWLKAKQ